MKIAICGSYAYDIIMNFHDSFKNHILPDKVHMLNVAFLVPELRREFGGCAGNIVYNTNLLGLNAYPVATVGSDFIEYAQWLKTCNIFTDAIITQADEYTAQAYITTDKDDNQITAFHPGAMSLAHHNSVIDTNPELAIVAPDGKEAMIVHAQALSENNVPFIFDPGQGLPMFNADELKTFIAQASWVIVNNYESEMLQATTGLSIEDIAIQLQGIIVTKGSEGSELYADNTHTQVAPVTAQAVVDPTGCGDSFRAGVLFALAHNLSLEEGMRLGNIIGSIKVAHQGTQNHSFTRKSLREVYITEYGEQIAL